MVMWYASAYVFFAIAYKFFCFNYIFISNSVEWEKIIDDKRSSKMANEV